MPPSLSRLTQRTVESLAVLYMADSFSDRFVYHLSTQRTIRGIAQEKVEMDPDELEAIINPHLEVAIGKIFENLDGPALETLEAVNHYLDLSAKEAADEFIRRCT